MNVLTRWSYLNNPFDNSTKRNTKRMKSLATDHLTKLKKGATTDSVIQELYDYILPAYEAFTKYYTRRTTLEARYQMETQRFANAMALLMSKKIKRWEALSLLTYDDTTPEYNMIFPNGREPFRASTYDDRISETSSLAERLQMFPDLADLQIEVSDYANDLFKLRDIQQGFEKDLADIRDTLEQSRFELAKKMHAVFGRLIFRYIDDLRLAENYYELQYLIRSNNSTDEEEDNNLILLAEEGSVVAGERVALFGKNMSAKTNLLVENTGDVPLRVWVGNTADGKQPESALIIESEQSTSFVASELVADGETASLLIIANPGGSVGNYIASVLA
ncbi:MAG: hypothetical protein ACPG5B_16440 [Chitinophagales bacterium]